MHRTGMPHDALVFVGDGTRAANLRYPATLVFPAPTRRIAVAAVAARDLGGRPRRGTAAQGVRHRYRLAAGAHRRQNRVPGQPTGAVSPAMAVR
jgi:hypothetical protein